MTRDGDFNERDLAARPRLGHEGEFAPVADIAAKMGLAQLLCDPAA